MADPTIPASDGAPARSFVALLRSVMSGARAFANDRGGTIITTGTANAYVVQTASGVAVLRPGLSFLIKIDRANTGASTLNVDGTGPKPWRNVLGSELDANDLLAGAFIRATWDDGRGAWVSETSSSPSFNAAFRTWSAGLPTSPAGLAPGEPWRNGDTIAFVPNP